MYVNFENSRNTKITYVSDINEVQKLLKDKGIAYTLTDVKASKYVDYSVSTHSASAIIVIFIILMITNRQAGGGANPKMMNFGKSRARLMTTDDNKVTFKNVAGLKEEKKN